MDRRKFLQSVGAGATAALCPRLARGAAPGPGEVRRTDLVPNLIFVLTDDLGFDLLSCYGSDQFKTPHVDALAAEGIRFRFCHTSPVCIASRAQFLAGQHPFRNDHIDGPVTKVPSELPSVARVLKEAGYATALDGKWMVNGRPSDWGFDEEDKTPGQRYWAGVGKDGKPLYKPDLMHDWAVWFIERNAHRPFFLWYSLHVPHADLSYTPDSAPETIAQSKDRNLDPKKRKAVQQTIMADNLAYMDKLIGKLMAELDRLKLREKTMVLFSGDNGTAGHFTIGGRRLAGAKRHMTDGGPAVPLIVRWPGTAPAGKVSDDLVGFEDFLPMFADLAGAEMPKGHVSDGVSFSPQLRGEKGKPQETIFTQFQDQWFVRDQRRKLYHDGRLVDTSDYPFQEKLLPADAEPEVRKRFQKVMDDLGVAKDMEGRAPWKLGGKMPTWSWPPPKTKP